MIRRISPEWKKSVIKDMSNHTLIDHTTGYNKAIQWLIIQLVSRKILFKMYDLGAGVRRITTEVDICPCCKRKLK